MTKESFIKELNFKIDEELCYDEISNAANSVWISTVATENDGFEFIRDKSNSNFFVGKLHRFPKTLLEIQNQNRDILQFCKNNKDRITRIYNTEELCKILNIDTKNTEPHDYRQKDIQVYVYN